MVNLCRFCVEMSLTQGPTLTSKAMENKLILPPPIDLDAFLTKWRIFIHSLASVCRTLVVLKVFPWTGILHIATDPLKVSSQRGNSGSEAEFESYGTNSEASSSLPI